MHFISWTDQTFKYPLYLKRMLSFFGLKTICPYSKNLFYSIFKRHIFEYFLCLFKVLIPFVIKQTLGTKLTHAFGIAFSYIDTLG